jgi:nucleotide-binding universal stress UspA family protein
MTNQPDDVGPTLVVGHSRDPSSDHALAVAADLGRRLDARLHVVHVVDIGDYPSDIDAADWEERGQQELAAQRARVERTLADTGLGWTYEARRGDPAVELARAAEEHEALLIVVGTRGEGLRVAITRLIEPSVSHGVIHHQHRPVLVVPALEGDTGNDLSADRYSGLATSS